MMTIVLMGPKSLRLELDILFCIDLTAKLGGGGRILLYKHKS